MTDLHLRYQMARGLSIDGWIKNVENAIVATYAQNPGFHLYDPLAATHLRRDRRLQVL